MRTVFRAAAALLLFSSAGLAAAQLAPPDLVGNWTLQFVNSFGQRQQCTVNLTGDTTLWGKLAASSNGCGTELMNLAGWEASGNQLTLTDMGGSAVGTFTCERRNWSGTVNRDKSALLFRAGHGNAGVGGQNTGQCVFYGFRNKQCAAANDLRAPQTPPGQSVTVRMLGNNPVFASRAIGSAILGRVPINSCVQVSDCRAPDAKGDEWCQVAFGELHGYTRKVGYDAQHRYLNFSNRCGQ